MLQEITLKLFNEMVIIIWRAFREFLNKTRLNSAIKNSCEVKFCCVEVTRVKI